MSSIWDFSTLCYNTQMPKRRIVIILGVLIALMPILGFPNRWESVFQVIVGLSVVLVSVWSTIDKRLTLKAKAHKRHTRKVQEALEIEPLNQTESDTETFTTKEHS